MMRLLEQLEVNKNSWGHQHNPPCFQSQQTRFIHKNLFKTEPGWKRTDGYKWMVKFPADGKYTMKKLTLHKLGGRDPETGRVVVKTLGGGAKKKYRWVDNCRHGPKEGPPLVERVMSIQYDPCKTARIAVVAGGDRARFILATSTMKPGDLISTSGHIPRIAIRPKEGDAHPLGALPVGTEICCVEKYPGEGGTIAINAGSRVTLTRKVGDRCIIAFSNKHEYSLSQECMAVVGHLSNEEHSSKHIGSAQRLRWLGRRPRSGLWQRKDGRYGRKIRPIPPVKVLDSPKVDKTIKMQLNMVV
uniref:EOG090X0COM n=1 Tax=Eubosmina coregoni TaxID=186181 RepID=A0A4Y7LRR8_9CRUS|nr:EOG090X0COM [Eubosmina coregoni]SVE70039.1 EOG090X0COM [Eubosmina coregoni]